MGQAIVIISGGIDLSVGAMMALVNVLAAKYMVTSRDSTVARRTPGTFRRAILVSLLWSPSASSPARSPDSSST